MQNYRELIKNSAAFRLLSGEAHAQLVCTKDSVGAVLLARFFVESVTGKTNHPDITELPLDEEKHKILVEDIDALTSAAALTPIELRHKYYIIKYGETMNDSSANKLLKTLEEPPPAVRIIILSKDENAVLPTIRSRCRIINLEPFDAAALNEIIDTCYGLSPHAYLAKELHLGSIERLKKAIAGGYEQALNAVFECLLYMKKSTQILVHAQRLIARKDETPDIIDFFELALHDAMMFSLGRPLILNHRRADTALIAAFYSPDVVIRLKDVFNRARKRLEGYGNINSVVDELLFSLLEVRQKCG